MRIIGLSNYDIVIRRGDTFRLSVTARVKNGAAIDITGYTFLGLRLLPRLGRESARRLVRWITSSADR